MSDRPYEHVTIEQHEDSGTAKWRASVGVSFVVENTPEPHLVSEPRVYGGYGATKQDAITNLAETLANVLSYEQTQTRTYYYAADDLLRATDRLSKEVVDRTEGMRAAIGIYVVVRDRVNWPWQQRAHHPDEQVVKANV